MIFSGEVKIFPGISGWRYIDVPIKDGSLIKGKKMHWGMVPITATVGNTTWQTKLMRISSGGYFLALKKKVRLNEKIEVGDNIKVTLKI